MAITSEVANSDEFNGFVHVGAFNISTDRKDATVDLAELLSIARKVRVRVGYKDGIPVVSHHYLKANDAAQMISDIGLTIDGKDVY